MTRLIRLTYCIGVLFFFFCISLMVLFRYHLAEPNPISNIESMHVGTKYLSWLPHGEFTDQHEAFRNAIRLGMELDRTVIAPMLRLGKPVPWQPFNQLARTYSTLQDKQHLRRTCTTSASTVDDCITMNDWIEIPWSSLFDLKAISAEFGIPVIERLSGHGLGLEETAQGVHSITDVVTVDVLTFMENATFTKPWHGFYGDDKPKPLDKPLKTIIIQPQQWETLAQRQYIQFGALSSTARYQVHPTIEQMQLRKALNRHLFVSPNQMGPLQQQADQVVAALGGWHQFSTLKLDFAKVIALDARMNLGATAETMDDLDAGLQKDLMDAVVLEVFGDIPINQAVLAAMPVNQDSELALILSQQQPSSPIDRRKLLDACLAYRQTVEAQYPIYYLVNDHIPSPSSRPDIYGPLLSFFPCLFTKNDMKQWGKLDMSTWISSHPYLQDRGVDYEKMLDPMLDILIAGKGYSFFEVPYSPLTRFMNWQGRASADSNLSI